MRNKREKKSRPQHRPLTVCIDHDVESSRPNEYHKRPVIEALFNPTPIGLGDELSSLSPRKYRHYSGGSDPPGRSNSYPSSIDSFALDNDGHIGSSGEVSGIKNSPNLLSVQG